MSLADYYAASGTPPGVFLGAGLAALDGGGGRRSAQRSASSICSISSGCVPIRSPASRWGVHQSAAAFVWGHARWTNGAPGVDAHRSPQQVELGTASRSQNNT